MFVPYHVHLIVKGFVKNPPQNAEELNRWLIELVKKVDMAVVAGPTSVYVDEVGNRGITGTITLATSHASIHVWDEQTPSLCQFDLYSCKKYSIEAVLAHFDLFDSVSYEWILIDRNDTLKVVSSGVKEFVSSLD